MPFWYSSLWRCYEEMFLNIAGVWEQLCLILLYYLLGSEFQNILLGVIGCILNLLFYEAFMCTLVYCLRASLIIWVFLVLWLLIVLQIVFLSVYAILITENLKGHWLACGTGNGYYILQFGLLDGLVPPYI